MKRRILSALLAMFMTLSAIPAVTAAQVDLAASTAETVTEAPAAEAFESTAAPTDEPTEAVTEPVTEAPTAPATKAPAVVRKKTTLAATAATEKPILTRVAPTSKGVKITWEKYPDAAKTFVFLRKSDNSGWKKIGESASTSFEYKDLTSNVNYIFAIRAADKNGDFISPVSDRYPFHYLTAPKITGTESVYAGQKVVWEPVTGAVSYRVYIKSGSSWLVAGTTDTNSCVNTRVTSGKAYTYTVRCYDKENNVLESYFDTKGYTGVFYGAPKISSFNAVKNGVSISWTNGDGAPGYAIFRKLSTGWKKIGTTYKTSYTDTGLRYSARYTYTIRCINSKGKYISGYDAAGSSFTHLKPPSISDVQYRDQQYKLKWNKQTTASHYRVYRKELGGKWKCIGKSDTNSYTDQNAKKTGVYSYTVRSLDSDDNYLTYYEESGNYYCMGMFVIGSLNDQKPNTNPRYTCEVTEDELRQITAVTATGWLGAVEGDNDHKDILSYYNSYSPLAFNYAMSPHDAWCAAFVSAVWIRTGLAPYICTECGCGRFIDLAKKYNIWTESDAYVPKVGDAIIYNWSDSGYGECVTGADHIGIVTSVSGNNFTVTEGNTGTGYVGTHDRTVNCRYIRGFVTPNYKQIALFLSLKARFS